MADITEPIVEEFSNHSESYYILKYHDVMTEGWFWFRTPVPVIFTLFSYIAFVFYLGPRFMKNRQPYDLKYALRAYNILQIAHNASMIIWAFTEPLYVPVLLQAKCLNLNPAEGRAFAMNAYIGHWQFFSNKVLDLVDTIFFVLRKKQKSITFLHVFHHVTMVAVVWVFGRYTPGTEAAMAGLVNLTIHIVMYTYYFLASFGDKFANVLRFKRYLTIMQISQFVFVIAHGLFVLTTGCIRSPIILKLVMMEEFANLILFLNFYRKAYGPGKLENVISKFSFCQIQLKTLFEPTTETNATTTTTAAKKTENGLSENSLNENRDENENDVKKGQKVINGEAKKIN